MFFFFNDTATTEIYTLSLHDALPILSEKQTHRRRHRDKAGSIPTGCERLSRSHGAPCDLERRSRSEEHTSELQSHLNLVCRLLLEKKKINNYTVICETRLYN